MGSGSLAAFLPYGNANVQTEALLREHILPRRGSLPVVAGVLANDPTCPLEARLSRLQQLGVDGVVNWPAVGVLDGRFREVLEAEGYGTDSEIAMLARARDFGLATFAFVETDGRACEQFAAAGVDGMILNLGLTHEVQEARQRRDRLQHASAVLNIMLDGVRRSGRAPVSWLSVARSLPGGSRAVASS